MAQGYDSDESGITARENKPRSRKGLWLLIGLLLGLIIGGLLGGAIGSMFKGANTALTSQTTESMTATDESTSSTDAVEAVASRLNGREGSSARYAQYLAEALRESVDTPSSEATAAQEALNNVTGDFVSALHSDVVTKSGQEANAADLKAKVDAVNNAFIKYTVSATSPSPSEADVTNAMDGLTTYLTQTYRFSDNAHFASLMTSFKNATLEASRDFVAEKYSTTYAKYSQAQQDFTKAIATLKNK